MSDKSETPRTDAEIRSYNTTLEDQPAVPVSFARQLERELAAAQAEVAALKAEVERLCEVLERRRMDLKSAQKRVASVEKAAEKSHREAINTAVDLAHVTRERDQLRAELAAEKRRAERWADMSGALAHALDVVSDPVYGLQIKMETLDAYCAAVDADQRTAAGMEDGQ